MFMMKIEDLSPMLVVKLGDLIAKSKLNNSKNTEASG